MAALIPIAWVVATPFALAAIIAGSPRANRVFARNFAPLVALGWVGVAMLATGAFVVDGTAQALLLAAGAPLAGLSFWMRSDIGGDEGPDDDDDDPGPGPEPDEIDWDAFLADLERWRAKRPALTAGGRRD